MTYRCVRAAVLSILLTAGTCLEAEPDACSSGGCPVKGHQLIATNTSRDKMVVSEDSQDSSEGVLGGVVKLGKGQHDLHRMAAELQTLAQSVVNGTEYLSDTQAEVLKDIEKEMGDLIAAIASSHSEDQGEVDRARDSAAECSVPNAQIDNSRTITSSEEVSHTNCRIEEKALKAQMGSACNLYHSIVGNQDPAACFATYNPEPKKSHFDSTIDCLQKIIGWAKPLNESWVLNKRLCKEATELHAKKVQECHHEQTEFEIAFCSYHDKLTGACSAYTTCRTDAKEQRSDVHTSVQVAEKGRKAEHSAAVRVKCFLGVFSASPEEQPTKLQECVDLNPDTKSLDITYHELPAELPCDTTPVSAYPCEAKWVDERYESKDWYSDAPTKACTACVHLSEKPDSKQSTGGGDAPSPSSGGEDTAGAPTPAPAADGTTPGGEDTTDAPTPAPVTDAPTPAPQAAAPTPAPLNFKVVTIGRSNENKKCVDAEPGVFCPPTSGNKYIRVNRDNWGRDNTYEVTMENGKVCAERLDLPHGWDMELQLRCE